MDGPRDSISLFLRDIHFFEKKWVQNTEKKKKSKKISTLSSFTSTYAAPSPLFQLKPQYTRNLARCPPPARCGAGTALARVGSSPDGEAWAAAAQFPSAPPLRYPPGTPHPESPLEPPRAPRRRPRWRPDPPGGPQHRPAPPAHLVLLAVLHRPQTVPGHSEGLRIRYCSCTKIGRVVRICLLKNVMTVKLGRVPSWILKTFK